VHRFVAMLLLTTKLNRDTRIIKPGWPMPIGFIERLNRACREAMRDMCVCSTHR